MERKNIGGFIAALRKASGMTQKDLAGKLNVSDKTVSRWERGDGDPDLALIPVIAEIFGVTCDELLRGERRSPGERVEPGEYGQPTPKGEKQLQRLLSVSLSQYQNRTYIAMGISVVGLIAALIGNLAFYRAVLGALLGAVFFAASVVCQAVFLNNAFSGVADVGIGEDDIHRFKRDVIRLAQRSVGLTVTFIGFTFPLIWVDAYVGLGPDNLLLFGGIGGAVFLAVYAAVCFFLNARLLKRGVYALDERAEQVYWHNHRLKKRCTVVLLVVMAVTLAGQVFINETGQYLFSSGITFTDYDSFVTFMEQEVPYDSTDWVEDAARVEQVGNTTYYYDEDGSVMGISEYPTETLEDSEGNVVQYIRRNRSVVFISYRGKDGSLLPITVRTRQDIQAADNVITLLNICFAAVYCVELLTAVLIYKKRGRGV